MALDETPMLGSVEEYRPLKIEIVNKTELEPLWDEIIRKHHYLGFGKMIGQSIKYLVWSADRPVAALSYNRAALRIGVRDAHIGWTEEGRRQYLKNVVSNHRFLILPWVRVKNLASHVLAQSLRMLRRDWKKKYGHEPQLVETYVDSDRYKGTCYLAANWKYVGETKGYGKRGKRFEYHGSRKKVFLYELSKGFVKDIAPHLRRSPQSKQWERARMLMEIPDWNPKLLESAGITPERMRETGAMLWEYLGEYEGCFSHMAQGAHFARYAKGLLSDLERKSVEPIALRYGDENDVRVMQYFLKSAPWSDKEMLRIYQSRLSAEMAEPDGMITVDGCDFPKKGKKSVGVARQHCGPLGKTDNCQASVMAGYSGSKGYGLIDRRLYLPEKWMAGDYAEHRRQCGIPEHIGFMTKNEMAIEMIRSARASGMFPAKWVGADAAFGHDSKFLDAIPEGMHYFADIHCKDRFYPEAPEISIPAWRGVGRKPARPKASEKPEEAARIVEESETPWQQAVFGLGSKGPVAGHEKLLRVLDVRDGMPGKWVWLYARRLSDGSAKYSVSNAPEDTPPEKFRELALRRWPIEQCFEECKSELGMDHYEGRSWNGWHRHILIVFIAHLFLQLTRRKFSVEADQLSEHGQKVFQNANGGGHSQPKAVILTAGQARMLVQAIFTGDIFQFRKTIRVVGYGIRNYAKSFRSYCKKFKETYPQLANQWI